MKTFLGMHYNDVGAAYVVCGPIILYKALSKNPLWVSNFVLSLVSIFLLQSRTTLVIFVLACSLLLVLMKKKFFLILIGGFLALIIFIWIPTFIFTGLSTGASSGTLDSLLSGRVEGLWLPLLEEWVSDPFKFLFGAGRFGLMTSHSWTGGYMQAGHAHNGYLDFFLDSGIILFSLFIYFLAKVLKYLWRHGHQINLSIYWTLFACLFGYLGGMASRGSVFPGFDNMFIYPILALLINIIGLTSPPRTSSRKAL